MRIAIHDPYLDILGGGERYLLTIAEHFASLGEVTLFWRDPGIKSKIRSQLAIDVERVHIESFPNFAIERFLFLQHFDLVFYATDGSLFFSPAKKNILLIQSPDHIPSMQSFKNRATLLSWPIILCYSRYVAKFIEGSLAKKVYVLPPAVDTASFVSGQKENIILSTGRFFSHLHSKKQDLLVQWFLNLIKKSTLSGWKLVLIGSLSDAAAKNYLEDIKKLSRGRPIEILTDASFATLQSYYSRAKIFWLATGFDEDLVKHPEKAEHFGIVTVEAMAAGCVPVVFNGGGQPEIVEHKKNGFLFNSADELFFYTHEIATHEELRRQMSRVAQQRSQAFSKKAFIQKLHEVIAV